MRTTALQILLFAFFSGVALTPDTTRADWPCAWSPYCNKTGLEKGSQEWWEYQASLPVGARQKYKKGKMWPPYPRPTDPRQPFWHQFHSAHYWPHPYNKQDECIVRVFQEAQIAEGWKHATTFYEHHFDANTNQLTRAGRQHLLWVLENAHEQHRVAYVQASVDKQVNDSRLNSVSQTLAEFSGAQNSVSVLLHVTSPVFRPASEVDAYQRAWVQGMHPPHIQYNVESSSSK